MPEIVHSYLTQADKSRKVLDQLSQFTGNTQLHAAKALIEFKLHIRLEDWTFDQAMEGLTEIFRLRKQGYGERKESCLPWESIVEAACLSCSLCTTGNQLRGFIQLLEKEFQGHPQLPSLQHCVVVSIMKTETFNDMNALEEIISSIVSQFSSIAVDATTKRSWQTLLWNMAYEGYEESDLVSCQKWSKVLALLVTTAQQRSALYRLQASCALQNDDIEAANTLANAAVHQAKDIFSLMIKFKAMVSSPSLRTANYYCRLQLSFSR